MFLVYINFEKSHFTLFGGLNETSLTSNKNLVESEDYSQDKRLFLSNTGKEMESFDGSGVVDPDIPKALFVRLLNAQKNGTPLRFRLHRDSDLFTIEGDFLVNTLSFADSVGDSIRFNISLQATGTVVYS